MEPYDEQIELYGVGIRNDQPEDEPEEDIDDGEFPEDEV